MPILSSLGIHVTRKARASHDAPLSPELSWCPVSINFRPGDLRQKTMEALKSLLMNPESLNHYAEPRRLNLEGMRYGTLVPTGKGKLSFFLLYLKHSACLILEKQIRVVIAFNSLRYSEASSHPSPLQTHILLPSSLFTD